MAAPKVPKSTRKRRVETPPEATPRPRFDRSWWAVIGGVAFLIVAALVTVSLISAGGDDDGEGGGSTVAAGTPLPGAEEIQELLQGIPQDGQVLGEPDAPVTVAVYADPQCPACAGFAVETLPELVERYVRPGDVQLDYRGVPIIGPDSEVGLTAAYAAGLQGHLWHFSDITYAHQGEENDGWLDDDFIRAAAGSFPEIDVEQLFAGRDSDEVKELLAEDVAEAQRVGLQGTPTFQIGRTGEELGEPVLGGDITALAEQIDPLLGR